MEIMVEVEGSRYTVERKVKRWGEWLLFSVNGEDHSIQTNPITGNQESPLILTHVPKRAKPYES